MKSYLKKSLIVSMGALFSATVFADDTYTVDGLTYTVDGYSYTFDSTPTVATAGVAYTTASTSNDLNYVFNNVAGESVTDTAILINGSTILSGTISGVFANMDSTMPTYNAGAIFIGSTAKISGTLDGLFINNTNTATGGTGGAICLNTTSNSIATLTGTFINNSATAYGGAIYNKGTIGLKAISYDTVFTGNTDSTGSNAIYSTGTITFNSSDGYSIIVNDGISGSGKMTIQTGTTVFNNVVTQATLTVSEGATLALGSYGNASADLSGVTTFTVNGTLSLVASEKSTINVGSVSFGDDAVLALDLSDIFGSFELTIEGTTLDLSNFDSIVLSDGTEESISIDSGDTTYDLTTEGYAGSYITISGSTITGYITGTAVPEPSTYAMIFGVVALGFAAYRRKQK